MAWMGKRLRSADARRTPAFGLAMLLPFVACGCRESAEVRSELTVSGNSESVENEVGGDPASGNVAGPTTGSHLTVGLTYNKHIAPIIFDNCATCHRPGQSAPFALLTFADVTNRASQIIDVVTSGYMPPWLPEPGYGVFAGERRLSAQQKDMLRQWNANGGIEGDPTDLPPLPKFPTGWHLGEPDMVLTMPKAYTLWPEGADTFRKFVIPIPPRESNFVNAVEIQPGNPRIVHHAELLVDKTQLSRDFEQKDGEPGFDFMEIAGRSESADGHFLGWTPGKVPSVLPKNLAWRLEAGSDLVLLLHMVPSGKPERIQSKIGLFFTDTPPTATAVMVRIGLTTIDIPAGEKNYVVEDQYVLPVDVEALSIYPHAHYLAHKMEGYATLPNGKRKWLVKIDDWDFNWQDQYQYKEPIFLPRGTTLSMKYTYDNSADNDRNPHVPPKRVTYGEKSADEMGDLWLQVLPKNREDFVVLRRAHAEKETQALMLGIKKMLELDPQNARHHHTLAGMYLKNGDSSEAMAHFEAALHIDPNHFHTHNSLGRARLIQGQIDEAMRHCREALRLRPNSVYALTTLGLALGIKGQAEEGAEYLHRAVQLYPSYANAYAALGYVLLRQGRADEALRCSRQLLRLRPEHDGSHALMASALMSAGRLDEAIDRFRKANELNPSAPQTQRDLAAALERKGDWTQAVHHYRQSLRQQPAHAGAHYRLAMLLYRQDRTTEAIPHLRAVLESNPDHVLSQNNLAWMLATHTDDTVRNGNEALRLATQLNKQQGAENPQFLSTLAASLACVERYEEAATTARKAVSLALASNQQELAEQIKGQLRHYERRQPYRENNGQD